MTALPLAALEVSTCNLTLARGAGRWFWCTVGVPSAVDLGSPRPFRADGHDSYAGARTTRPRSSTPCCGEGGRLVVVLGLAGLPSARVGQRRRRPRRWPLGRGGAARAPAAAASGPGSTGRRRRPKCLVAPHSRGWPRSGAHPSRHSAGRLIAAGRPTRRKGDCIGCRPAARRRPRHAGGVPVTPGARWSRSARPRRPLAGAGPLAPRRPRPRPLSVQLTAPPPPAIVAPQPNLMAALSRRLYVVAWAAGSEWRNRPSRAGFCVAGGSPGP